MTINQDCWVGLNDRVLNDDFQYIDGTSVKGTYGCTYTWSLANPNSGSDPNGIN